MVAQTATRAAARPRVTTSGGRPASRTPRPAYHELTFRTWPPERRTRRDGTQVIVVCEELVGGRWEPFCSIHQRRPAQPATVGQPASCSSEGA